MTASMRCRRLLQTLENKHLAEISRCVSPAERQRECLKPLTHSIEEATCIVLMLEAGHEVIGVAHDDHVASGLLHRQRHLARLVRQMDLFAK